MINLSINFQSIQINNNLIRGNQKIKITVFTFPEQDKKSIVVDPKNFNKNDHIICFTTKNNIKKLIFIFEKKNIFQLNPMIASRAIDAAILLNTTSNSPKIEHKTFDIYKPIRCQDDLNQRSRIAGKISIQCTSSIQYSLENKNSPYNISKIHKGEGYSIINENQNGNKLLLLGDEFVN